MIDTQGLAKMLMGTWNTTKQPLKERGTILPIGEYEDGSVSLAWPGLIAAPVEGMANFGSLGYDTPEAMALNARSAFDVVGAAMTGGLATGLAGGMVDNALGSAGGIAKSGPEMLRAYHGTRNDIVGPLRPSPRGTAGPGVYAAYDEAIKNDSALANMSGADIAELFARGADQPYSGGERILPLDVRGPFADESRLWDLVDDFEGQGLPTADAVNRAQDVLRGEGITGIKDGGVLTMIQPGNTYSTTTGDLLYSNAKPGAAIPLATQAAEQQAPRGIRAYHGSPHDFDQFSLDKIGTGEGAQAYGYGLYFAESEDVARYYRDALTSRKTHAPPAYANTALEVHGGDKAKALAYAEKRAKSDEDTIRAQRWSDAALYLRGELGTPVSRMYEVNIRANPEDFLDWDKPLSQQSEAVRAALVEKAKEAAARGSFPAADTNIIETLLAQDVPASEFYTRNRNVFGRAEDASSALREAGIPGIKYLDGMSRGAGDGTANYVVFDDQLIDILRKYANAPTGASIPLGLEAQQETDVDPALMEVLRQYGLMPSN